MIFSVYTNTDNWYQYTINNIICNKCNKTFFRKWKKYMHILHKIAITYLLTFFAIIYLLIKNFYIPILNLLLPTLDLVYVLVRPPIWQTISTDTDFPYLQNWLPIGRNWHTKDFPGFFYRWIFHTFSPVFTVTPNLNHLSFCFPLKQLQKNIPHLSQWKISSKTQAFK